ncbi:MAG TPA: hypothetical protein DEF45_17435 [Rhodopirellula sp.]|nr:MAG: hypothetical protein CBD74_05365 [Saprospirales bacterium TMED214]HBV64797.1 hypothetical protein [Rhodopirellula sp.]
MGPKSCWASNAKYRGSATRHHGDRRRGEGRSTATVSLSTLFQRIDQPGCKHAVDSLNAITATSSTTDLPCLAYTMIPKCTNIADCCKLESITCRNLFYRSFYRKQDAIL